MENKTPSYGIATRPYSLIDAVNRVAAATGSVGYAMATSRANYNGHFVRVYHNGYRGYWLAEYFWGERVVLCRGSLANCLRAAKAEHDRGALGSQVSAHYPDNPVSSNHPPDETREDFARLCTEVGYTREDEMPAETWRTPLYDRVADAMRYERQFGVPAVAYLIKSTTVEEYEAKLDAHFKAQTRTLTPE